MGNRTRGLRALLGTALALVVFGPGAAEAQKSGSTAMSIGTTAKYEGVMPLPSDCQSEVSYEQFMKVAGQVILPETRANVYKFVEYWGRDSGTQVQRIAANGNVFLYLSRGVEQRVFVNGPVGTYLLAQPRSRAPHPDLDMGGRRGVQRPDLAPAPALAGEHHQEVARRTLPRGRRRALSGSPSGS